MSRIQIAMVWAGLTCAAAAQGQMIGINVLLNTPPTSAVLGNLGTYGQVLDVIPEINAVTLRAQEGQLAAIQALPYVAAAEVDSKVEPAAASRARMDGFGDGANVWNLDAINVTQFGVGRTVPYDGTGVYVAVIDTGLAFNWREYFPEERVATQFARAFAGGGGEVGTVSSQPNVWEHDNPGHGTPCTGHILGFRYVFEEPALPPVINGVAPGATVIPVKAFNNNIDTWGWNSVLTRAILYVADLKTSGALGGAPVVISASWGGGGDDPLMTAAIDYAIAHGVIFVAAAGNDADAGMRFPGRYAPVISAAAFGWKEQFPVDDPTRYEWSVRNVPEGDTGVYFIAPFSSWALPGQDLDVAAPGSFLPAPLTVDGREDYSYNMGTSAACPHIAGVAALMLQKNPTLTQAQIETILESTAMPLSPGCRDTRFGFWAHPGSPPWPTARNNFQGMFVAPITTCWEDNATGAGLLQADAALAATPLP